MDTRIVTCPLERARFEVLPFARSLEAAAQLPEAQQVVSSGDAFYAKLGGQ